MNSRRFEEARAVFVDITNQDPGDADAWYMLSAINGMLGDIDEADRCCRRVLALQPDRAEAHVVLGNILRSQGKRDAAEASYQTAIQLNPGLAVAYLNLGNLQLQQEQYDKAVHNYRKAVTHASDDAQIKAVGEKGRFLVQENRLDEARLLFDHLCRAHPEDAQAWYTLSVIHGSLGEINAAGECCRRVLAIQPDHSGAHANLGNVFFHHRRFDEAIAQYQEALASDPQNNSALHNMGKACQTDDHIGKYIEHYRRVITHLPNPAEARITFSEVMEYTFAFPTEYTSWLDEELQACFSTVGADYQPLGLIAAHLLKLKHHIGAPVKGDDDHLRAMAERIAGDNLFLMMLTKVVNKEADIELLLTKVCGVLLLDYCRLGRLDPREAGLVLALAYQGFNNEYVFSTDAEEERRVADLRQEIERSVASLIAPNKVLEEKLLVFGMFDRISTLSCKERLSRMPLQGWSESFRSFLTEALLNPLEEESIKEEIVSLAEITHSTSKLVQSQYEENPYPRWVVTARKTKENIRLRLQSTFPHFTPPSFLDGPVQILAAGCGTGKQAIQAALGYRDVEILAVDISKSSLAYAERMARMYNVTNIKFMHGDILDLGNLDRRFHIIDCIGVLHHMKDPLAGWKVLAGLLVEEGLMQIGLYSESARKVVVEARGLIEREGLAADTSTIRDFRARVLRRELGEPLYEMSSNSPDFYSTSTCRDLLFHYQEHRYTLSRLRKELRELRLDFTGFKGFRNVNIASSYSSHFPEDVDMTNLVLWERFEKLYPNTFGEMYHFWCQKQRNAA